MDDDNDDKGFVFVFVFDFELVDILITALIGASGLIATANCMY